MKRARSGRKPKSPAFQFYPGDYLTDSKILALSFEERGIWLHLICLAWLNGGLDSDTTVLARSCGLPQRDFDRAWRRIGAHFELRGDRLVNPRQEREREVQAINRARRSDAGKDGNAKRWHDSGDDVATDPASQCDRNAIAEASLPSPVSRAPSSQKNPTGSPPTPRPSPKRIPVEPDWSAHPGLDTPSMRVAWGTWSAHRRELKSKPWTPTGLAQCFAELAAMGPERAIAAIQHSIGRNYAGIYEPKFEAVRGPNGAPALAPGGLQEMFGRGAPPRPRTIETTGEVQRAEAG